ncbi:hypothetical protein SAY87_024771 [Trapa incisa]|uniref:NAC domain-containing protein n=1 Tax=Trapa incisa TaxID=236973 RepID=A0AAN7GKE5_9MYRT|nr:hypothetical protein SAY87_024771 [Trapa incisa]
MGEKMVSLKKLPMGYRLNPSDEDLVNHHLKRKLQDIHEDYCLIPEFDIYKLPPWDLITKFNDLSDLASDGMECYFFYRRSRPNGNRNSRKTKEGYWQVTGRGRKPQDTDQIKWLKRNLVFKRISGKSYVKSDWAMHEWEIISDKRIVVCHISKKKSKKGKGKVASVSFEACPIQSPGSTDGSEIQLEPQETSPAASVMTIMESQNMTPTSDINLRDFSISSPPHTNKLAVEGLRLAKNAYTDTMNLMDLEYLQDPPFPMGEQSPCSEDASLIGFDQRNETWPDLWDDTPGEGVPTHVYPQMPTDQGLNSLFHPQQPWAMPMDEIAFPIDNTSFNYSCSSSQLDNIRGHGVPLPFWSMKYGAGETNLEEAPLSPNPILTTERSSHSENIFIQGGDQEDRGWLYHGDVDLEEGGNVSVFDQTYNDQSLNHVSPQLVYPPQLPQVMPTEDISFLHKEFGDFFEDIKSLLDTIVSSPPCASGDTFEKCT